MINGKRVSKGRRFEVRYPKWSEEKGGRKEGVLNVKNPGFEVRVPEGGKVGKFATKKKVRNRLRRVYNNCAGAGRSSNWEKRTKQIGRSEHL